MLLETIQGEAGMMIPAEGYLQQVRTLCNSRGILMIAGGVMPTSPDQAAFACDPSSTCPTSTSLARRWEEAPTSCRNRR